MNRHGIRIFAGHSNKLLAQQIADYLDVPLGRTHISKYSNGETK
jgi:phosphoribosylpyrophosphate synthetase